MNLTFGASFVGAAAAFSFGRRQEVWWERFDFSEARDDGLGPIRFRAPSDAIF
jgi:hypothetical protein